MFRLPLAGIVLLEDLEEGAVLSRWLLAGAFFSDGGVVLGQGVDGHETCDEGFVCNGHSDVFLVDGFKVY